MTVLFSFIFHVIVELMKGCFKVFELYFTVLLHSALLCGGVMLRKI